MNNQMTYWLEFAAYGKVSRDNRSVSDWQYFSFSKGFPKALRDQLSDYHLRQPEGKFALKNLESPSVCCFRTRFDQLIFASIQPRWEGDLIGMPKTGRFYLERRLVLIPDEIFIEAFSSSFRLYSAIFDVLAPRDPVKGVRQHWEPENKLDLDPLEITLSNTDEPSPLTGSDDPLDQFAAVYAPTLWKSKGKLGESQQWVVALKLYRYLMASSPKHSVLFRLDASSQPDVFATEARLRVMELLQTVCFLSLEKRAEPIQFGLDFFARDVFDVLFAQPDDEVFPIRYSKEEKLATEQAEAYFDRRLIADLNNPLRWLFDIFYRAPFAGFEEAVARWKELRPLLSRNWGNFYIQLLEKDNLREEHPTANELLQILEQALMKKAITKVQLHEVLSNPHKFVSKKEKMERDQFLRQALGGSWPLARETIEFYGRKIAKNQRALEGWVNERIPNEHRKFAEHFLKLIMPSLDFNH